MFHEGTVSLGEAYVHCNRNNHQLSIEANKWLILHQSVLIEQSRLHNAQEIPVETRVHDHDEHLGGFVPDVVDVDE